ncbi:MAG: hypothetical protein IJB70_07965 [Clostridia bacterium]|nr:hypothetical protein [Clostridia bacterium]
MICEKCGKKVTGKSSICESCGHPIKFEGAGKFSINITATSGSFAPTEANTPAPVQIVTPPATSKGVFAVIVAIAVCISLLLGWLGNTFIMGDGSNQAKDVSKEVSTTSDSDKNKSDKKINESEKEYKISKDVKEEFGEEIANGEQYYLLAKEDKDNAVITIYDCEKEEAVLENEAIENFIFNEIFNLPLTDEAQASAEPTEESDGAEPAIIEVSFETMLETLQDNTVYIGEGVFAVINNREDEKDDEDGWYAVKGENVYVISAGEDGKKFEFKISTDDVKVDFISEYKDGYMLAYSEDSSWCFTYSPKGRKAGPKLCHEKPDVENGRTGEYLFIDGKLYSMENLMEADDVEYDIICEDDKFVVEYKIEDKTKKETQLEDDKTPDGDENSGDGNILPNPPYEGTDKHNKNAYLRNSEVV